MYIPQKVRAWLVSSHATHPFLAYVCGTILTHLYTAYILLTNPSKGAAFFDEYSGDAGP